MSISGSVREALALLSPRDQRYLIGATGVQMLASLLDLIGVILIGLVAALSVTAVQSQPPPQQIATMVQSFGLGDLSDQTLVAVFALSAAVVLLTKSLVSSLLTRRVLIFLANRQALVAARLTKELLSRPLTTVQRRSSQETTYALITGATAATMGILGQVVVAATEGALLVVLSSVLVVVNPALAIGAVAFFVVLALILYRGMGAWAVRTGRFAATADIASMQALQEALSSYREIMVSNRRVLYANRVQELRWTAARAAADRQVMSLLPKYIFEGALVVGGLGLAAVLFATQDSVAAIATLALFLAAGSRIMPSILRLQSAALGLKTAAATAQSTFALAADLDHPLDSVIHVPPHAELIEQLGRRHHAFDAEVTISQVSVVYPGSSKAAIRDVTLSISHGESVAIVGPSGGGKSTLVDALLGVTLPSSGDIRIGDFPPDESIRRWPGGIAYVPQEVNLANGSIRSNVALGLPAEVVDDNDVWAALESAQLADYVRTLDEGLAAPVGERGVRLSGGQRQRLGVARALFTRPRLLVLDEATSALDAETEHAIGQMLSRLGTDITTIVVAHRLSTVRDVDRVIYVEDGRVVANGSFEEVVRAVPSFARQASLMGMSGEGRQWLSSN